MTVAALAEIADRVRGLFPCPVAVCADGIGASEADLWPVEAEAMRAAVQRRRAEFAAGRAVARRAIAELGLPPVAIPMQPDRSPGWPVGVAGSITHTDALALAAVARAEVIAAIGIDAEPDEPLPPGVAEMVCQPEERAWCATMPDPARAERLIFVAKEAAYKCQYPLSRAGLEFDALSIEVAADGALVARFTLPAGPFATGDRLSGRAARCGGFVIAAFALPHRP